MVKLVVNLASLYFLECIVNALDCMKWVLFSYICWSGFLSAGLDFVRLYDLEKCFLKK